MLHPIRKYEPATDQSYRLSGCRLLELPFKIRRQIYHAAGLPTNSSIDMNFSGIIRKGMADGRSKPWNLSDFYRFNHRDEAETIGNEDFKRFDLFLPKSLLPLNLLYVCHAMHKEVERLLYGENRFVITRRDPGGLTSLENLSISAIRQLRQLTIRINISSCVGVCCDKSSRCDNWREIKDWKHEHDSPFSSLSDSDGSLISQWRQICSHLANIVPDQLALYIICDCQDLEAAEMIIKPLLALPRLRDCAIRLSLGYRKQLQHLATRAVFLVTGRQRIPAAPFRFLDLPMEVQLQILAYTNLVSSRSWSRVYYFDDRFFHCEIKRPCSGDASVEPAKVDSCDASIIWLDGSAPRCFCTRMHSAFTFQCRCEDDPSKHFLVSRHFKDLAELVYYGKNYFIIASNGLMPTYYEGISSEVSRRRDHSATLPFVQWFRNNSLYLVKYLELNFKQLEPTSGLLSLAGWKQWLNTIDVLRSHPGISKLTLDIRMSEPFWFPPWEKSEDESMPNISELNAQREDRMINIYRPFFTSMQCLGQLKDLFINLNYETSDGYLDDDGRREQERILECLVMGEGYDAWKRGKRTKWPAEFFVTGDPPPADDARWCDY